MKKYKSINFIQKDTYKNNIKVIIYSFIIIIAIVAVSRLRIFKEKDIETTSEVNILEEDEVYSKTENKIYEDPYVKFEDIRLAYNLIGKDNISNISIDGNSIEVHGSCEDLNVLEILKNESKSKDFSINSIVKENNIYLFNLSYNTGV